MYMLPWIRVYNSTLLLQQQEILGLHIRKGKSYSSTWLGSSEAPSRTSDGKDAGSNPRYDTSFRVKRLNLVLALTAKVYELEGWERYR